MKKELLIKGFIAQPKNPPFNITAADGTTFNIATQQVTYPDVYLYSLENAFVSPFGMVFKNGLTVNEAIYDHHKSYKNMLTFYKKYFLGKIKRTETNCIVIHNSWYENYYHWCLEALPRLFVLKDSIDKINLILPTDLKKFHHQTMAFFDINSITYCDEHELIFTPLLQFSSFTAPGFGEHNPNLIREMSAFFKSKTQSTGKFNHIKNIYTSRSATSKRKCVNEDELLHLVKKYDFEIIVPDNLTVNDQIELFGNAKNVLGVHGSSFVNCLYMKKGSVIFDLVEKDHNDFCFFNIATALDVNYVYIRSKGVGPAKEFRNNDIVVDIKNLAKLLDQFLCR